MVSNISWSLRNNKDLKSSTKQNINVREVLFNKKNLRDFLVYMSGAILTVGAFYGLGKRDTTSREFIAYEGKQYQIVDSKTEGIYVSDYPNPTFANRIIDENRDGRPDLCRYVLIGPTGKSTPVEIYPNDQQTELFTQVTRDFYARRNMEAQK